MSKRIALATCALLAWLGSPAAAADQPVKAPEPVAAPSWAGLYIGAGFSRSTRTTTQGTQTRTSTNGISAPPPPQTVPIDFDQDVNVDGAFAVAGWLFQYNRFIFGVEGDYYFTGGRSETEQAFLLARGCSAGVLQTGNFGCASASSFGSFETVGHVRGLLGFEVTPRLMGFVAGGLAIGALGAGGTQVGAIIADSPSQPGIDGTSTTYGKQTLYGWTWGGGVQAKISQFLVGRVEYMRDEYRGPTQNSITATAVAGGSNASVTTNPERMKIVNETIRASLIYRFDPSLSIYDAAARDFAAFGAYPTRYSFAGFYAGVGISQNNYDYRMPGAVTLTIDDSTTPGVDFNGNRDLFQAGGKNGANFMLGYRYQWHRILVGIEREFVRGSKKVFEIPPGMPVFGANGFSYTCYAQFLPTIPCLDHAHVNGGVATRGRLRFVGGFEVTDSLMAFVGYGQAYGRAQGTSGGANGIVISPPSSPLVGAATVVRSQRSDITGRTIGGGFEFKATDDIIIRGEYARDTYTWNAIVCGGAGFGGTIGTVTTNSFARCATPVKITNEAYQASVVYRFWNPQQ